MDSKILLHDEEINSSNDDLYYTHYTPTGYLGKPAVEKSGPLTTLKPRHAYIII